MEGSGQERRGEGQVHMVHHSQWTDSAGREQRVAQRASKLASLGRGQRRDATLGGAQDATDRFRDDEGEDDVVSGEIHRIRQDPARTARAGVRATMPSDVCGLAGDRSTVEGKGRRDGALAGREGQLEAADVPRSKGSGWPSVVGMCFFSRSAVCHCY